MAPLYWKGDGIRYCMCYGKC